MYHTNNKCSLLNYNKNLNYIKGNKSIYTLLKDKMKSQNIKYNSNLNYTKSFYYDNLTSNNSYRKKSYLNNNNQNNKTNLNNINKEVWAENLNNKSQKILKFIPYFLISFFSVDNKLSIS